ncbi:MAG TPA: radical SAM protein [Candidatus Sumerlaeota bacterium]|nr:radical SAM protein [Candidatus Sumerlaeota bacterium]
MKICLISPYESVAAYGLRILSAVAKRGGHETTCLFLPLDFRETIPADVLRQTAEMAAACRIAGISLSSNYMRQGIAITESIRAINPGTLILWGGILPTTEPEECLKYCDIACVGEGEEALTDLLNRLEAGEPFNDIPNLYFRDSNGILISNPLRPLNRDLDSIPFPDYDCDGHYILDGGRIEPATQERLNKNLAGQYLTLSSRGCVHSCSFCCNEFLKDLYHGDKWFRRRSAGNLIAECIHVKETLPWVTEILFDDDAFMARTEEELTRFGDEYRAKVGIPFFVTGITPASLTEKKLDILINAGLSRLRIGIQTASDRVNFEIYQRSISHEKAEDAIKIIERNKHRLSRHHYDFIVDNPWETDEEKIQTLRFLLKIPRPWAINIYSLTFYPGTRLFERAVNEGLLKDKYSEVYEKSYKSYHSNYINRLFYFYCQSNLPTWVLELFVNRWILALRLNYPLWWAYLFLRDAKAWFRRVQARVKAGLGVLSL